MLYLKYLKKSLLSTFVGHIVWISLSTYVVINKSTIGIDNIPIFEVILFLTGLASSRIATMNIFSFKTAMYSSVAVETMFLLILSIAIYYNGISIMSGVILYLLIITLNGFINPIESESRRVLEDKKLKKDSESKGKYFDENSCLLSFKTEYLATAKEGSLHKISPIVGLSSSLLWNLS